MLHVHVAQGLGDEDVVMRICIDGACICHDVDVKVVARFADSPVVRREPDMVGSNLGEVGVEGIEYRTILCRKANTVSAALGVHEFNIHILVLFNQVDTRESSRRDCGNRSQVGIDRLLEDADRAIPRLQDGVPADYIRIAGTDAVGDCLGGLDANIVIEIGLHQVEIDVVQLGSEIDAVMGIDVHQTDDFDVDVFTLINDDGVDIDALRRRVVDLGSDVDGGAGLGRESREIGIGGQRNDRCGYRVDKVILAHSRVVG